jgi:hypothetical protein
VHLVETPPNIVGEYLNSPSVLDGCNRDVDEELIGRQFLDYYFAFSYNNEGKLEFNKREGGSTGASEEKREIEVVGKGDDFTAYFIQIGESQHGIYSKQSIIISGTLTSEGISNFRYSLIMLEKGDDPADALVPVNTYRIFKDNDGMAERHNWVN